MSSDKIAELEARLDKATKVYRELKAENTALKVQNADLWSKLEKIKNQLEKK